MPKSAELTRNTPESKDSSRHRRSSRKPRSTAEKARRRSRSKESLLGTNRNTGWWASLTNITHSRAPSRPASPQSDSRTSTTSEGRGNGHKRKVLAKTKRRVVDLSSRVGPHSGKFKASHVQSINTVYCDEPQPLHANGRHVHVSDSDLPPSPTPGLPRRASTDPSDASSPPAGQMTVTGAIKQNQEHRHRANMGPNQQQHNRESGISFTPLEPASYLGPRRRLPSPESSRYG